MPTTAPEVTAAATDAAAHCLDAGCETIRHCVEQLSPEKIWWRPHESMNSIGNLILHLAGNVRQWIVAGIGETADVRDRPAEFSQQGPIPSADLLQTLKETVTAAKRVLNGATADGMQTQRHIQGFELNGWSALLDSTTHFKGHTQEIVCLTRLQLGDEYRFHWQPTTAEEGTTSP